MGVLRKRMPVEVYTATSRITGTIASRHIHVRDELNDIRLSLLIFNNVVMAELNDLRALRFSGGEAWIDKAAILLTVPRKVKGATAALAQRSIQSKLGKNEHRILLDIPPFRVVGNFYFVGRFQIQDALRRDSAPFATLSNAQVTFLPDPAISFITNEIVFNVRRVEMLCAQLKSE